MRQQLLVAIRTHQLWAPGDRVAVAVSGGADSTALLTLLAQTQAVHGAELSMVTINHGWDPAASAWSDRAMGLAKTLGIPGQVHRVHPVSRSEDAARQARYEVFEALDVDRVALAHHQKDQAETVLIHLLRGTGPRGLGGMPRRRGRFVRPVLDMAPEDLRGAVEIPGIVDPSNEDSRYLRVRVRHALLPLLEEIRQGSIAALARSATYAAEDDVILRSLAAEIPLTPQALNAAPAALARRRLQEAMGPVSMGQIDAVMAILRQGVGTVQLGAMRRVLVRGDAVLILDEADSTPPVG